MAGGLRFTFMVPGDQRAQIDRVITAFGFGVRNLKPAWEALADYVTDVVSPAQFDTRGRRGGIGWAPLSPRYAKWKAKHYPGKGILEASGKLREALTNKTSSGHERIITLTALRVGVKDSEVPYAKYHQSGTLDRFGTDVVFADVPGMPRRRPLLFTERDKRVVIRTLKDYLIAVAEFRRRKGTDSDDFTPAPFSAVR